MMNNPHSISFAEIMMLGRHAANCDRYHVSGCDGPDYSFNSLVANNGQLVMQSNIFIQDKIWPHEDFSGINARNYDVGIDGFW